MTHAHQETPRAELSATPDGRVTIPAQVRRAVGIKSGQTLVVYVEHGRVVIEERTHLLARLQDEAITAATAAGHVGSAVDELIAERRAEAAREGRTARRGRRDRGTGRQRGAGVALPGAWPRPRSLN